MYDAKSEAHEFVGETRQEAVGKACAFFGVDEAGLVVHEPAEGEIYGLGPRTVVVAHLDGVTPGRGSDGDSGPRRDRDRNREPRRDRDRDRGRGRDREPRREAGPRHEERSGGGDARPDTPVESKGTIKGDIGAVGEFLLGVIERMQLGSFEISENAEGEFVVYELSGPAAAELGSGDGGATDALQLLANQMAMRESDDAPRVVVDAEGDLERRETFLGRLADRAARRSQDTRRSVALDPMNARDRRIIHVAIRDTEGVATMSIGTGRYRQVVVVPEGSPEYEEARRASEEATSREH